GGEIRYEYGAPEDGGFGEHVLSVSGGFAWDSGRLRATFERFDRSNLDGGERPAKIAYGEITGNPGVLSGALIYTYNGERYQHYDILDLLGFPADSWPDDVVAATPGLSYERYLVVPDNQDGTNLSLDDFNEFVRWDTRTTDASEGISLIPAQQRNTLQMGFDQDLSVLGQALTLSGNVYYSDRKTYAANGQFDFFGSLPV